MKHKGRGVLVGVFGLLLGAVPVLAHHSVDAEFLQNKEWTQTGVLSKIDWINPHTIIWFDVKDPKTGKVEPVGCQGHPPNAFSRAGLAKSEFRVGEEVTVTCLASKDGSKNWGFIKMIKYKSGQVIVIRDSGV